MSLTETATGDAGIRPAGRIGKAIARIFCSLEPRDANRSARKSRLRGVTLMEGLFVLVIAGLLIAGAVKMFGQSNQSAKANDAQVQVTALRGAIVRAVPPPNFGSSSNLMTVLDNVNAPVLEGIRVSSGGPYRNGWGGDITAVGSGATFAITFTGIPGEACLNIATSMRDLFALSINGSTVATLPPAAATVAALCNRSGSGSTGGNTMDFTFNG